MLLADGVEGCHYLLPFLPTQTQAYLLEIGLIVLAQLVEEHSLVLADTLDFLGIVKTAEINLATVVEHDAVLLETAAVCQPLDAVDGCSEVGVDCLLDAGAYLAHDQQAAPLVVGEDGEKLCD